MVGGKCDLTPSIGSVPPELITGASLAADPRLLASLGIEITACVLLPEGCFVPFLDRPIPGCDGGSSSSCDCSAPGGLGGVEPNHFDEVDCGEKVVTPLVEWG